MCANLCLFAMQRCQVAHLACYERVEGSNLVVSINHYGF